MIYLKDKQEYMLKIIRDFIKAAELAGIQISNSQISIRELGCPHKPNSLPKNKMGIYIFCFDKKYLKIGKAGPKSGARFLSQHYSSYSSKSNLAKSILNDSEMNVYKVNSENIGDWIKNNITRTDILIDESLGVFTLNYLESFLHCKLNPKYEGFGGQIKKS